MVGIVESGSRWPEGTAVRVETSTNSILGVNEAVMAIETLKSWLEQLRWLI